MPSLGALALLVIGVVLLLVAGEDGPTGDHERAERKQVDARVLSVTDGDTIRVLVGDDQESVRYIGIDTPESVIPGERPECFGKRASRFNGKLVEGTTVTLVFGAERRDRYDRLLAYVYVGDRLINAAIVRAGYARTLEIAPNTDLADRFARLQQSAANAGRGLWGAC